MSQHVRAERVSDVLQQRAQLLATMSTYKCDKARMLALSALPAAAQGLLVPYRTLARSTALTSDARFAQRLAVSYLLLILFFNLSRPHTGHESQGRADQVTHTTPCRGMGRNKNHIYERPEYDATGNDPWKRKRKERINQPPSTLNVDVHGILFAIVAVVFVVYPLAQWALGR